MRDEDIDELINQLGPEELGELEDTIDNIELKRARENSSFFTGYVIKNENDNPIEQGDIHKEWHKVLNSSRLTQIIAPRDHGKTTQMIGWVLWRLGHNPNLRIKYICQTDSQAKKRLSQIKQYIVGSDEYSEIFPDIRPSPDVDDWSKHSITVEREAKLKDSTIEAWGILSSATGGRADIIICDDVVDLKNAIQQPKLREQVKTQFRENWLNLLEPESEVKYIATKWHKLDLTCELEKGDAFETIEYSIDKDFNPIWEDKWPEVALRKKFETIGSQAFNRGFRNQPISDADRTFTDDILEQIQNKFDKRKLLSRYKGSNIFVGMDVAIGQNSQNSYSVIFVVLVDNSNRRNVIDLRRGQWTPGRSIEEILEVVRLYSPALMMVENNSFQETIIEWAEAKSREQSIDLPIEGFTTGYQKTDLDVGVPSLAMEMENGMWRVDFNYSEHQETGCSCNYCQWFKELASYPVGEKSDIVMANWMTLQAIRAGDAVNRNFDQQAKNIEEFLRRINRDDRNKTIKPKGVIDSDVFY